MGDADLYVCWACEADLEDGPDYACGNCEAEQPDADPSVMRWVRAREALELLKHHFGFVHLDDPEITLGLEHACIRVLSAANELRPRPIVRAPQ